MSRPYDPVEALRCCIEGSCSKCPRNSEPRALKSMTCQDFEGPDNSVYPNALLRDVLGVIEDLKGSDGV